MSEAGRPLDHPTPERPHRVYLALTNHCNRACPWCSTCSSPAGATYLSPEAWAAHLPPGAPFELQLEGGEPTVHPRFWDFVQAARANPLCRRLVLCTNGVRLPRRPEALRAFVERLGTPLTLKLSVNHHLLDEDPGLLNLCVALQALCAASPADDRLLVLNVRRRAGEADDDAAVVAAVAARGLLPHANVFFLQRYGFAADRPEWAHWGEPFAVADRFVLVNPDASAHGTDLVGRSEAMRALA